MWLSNAWCAVCAHLRFGIRSEIVGEAVKVDDVVATDLHKGRVNRPVSPGMAYSACPLS